jgi:hypothetical protein
MFDQLLKIWLPDGAAERPQPDIRIQANAGDPASTGVSKTRTTLLHPQSDGMVERYVKTLLHGVRK